MHIPTLPTRCSTGLDPVRNLYLQPLDKYSLLYVTGVAYVLGTLAWIFAVFAAFGVTITGMAANRGHRWAAGNRAYEPIAG